jgi:hypothetical protein
MYRVLCFGGLVAFVGSASARSISFAVRKDDYEVSFANDVLETTTVHSGWYNKVTKLLDNFRGGSIVFVYFSSQFY